MKFRLLLFVIVTSLCASCSNSRKLAATSTNVASNSTSMPSDTAVEDVSDGERDGSSLAKAVVIKERSTRAGVPAEYAWVRQRFPNSKVIGQALMHKGKKSYDMLTVQKADGGTEEVYFDITRFFGKW
jgi:hypothetical protein